MQLLSVSELQPGISFGFNRVQHTTNVQSAQRLYRQLKGQFLPIMEDMISANPHWPRQYPNFVQVLHITYQASTLLNKEVNALDEQDIADFFAFGTLSAMGTLNVTETMLAYLLRMEENDYNEFRNGKYNEEKPHYSPLEFTARFGPPPWETFNTFLRDTLDGRYYIDPPSTKDIEGYEAKLKRKSDGVAIDPSLLSSGEKVLMWLCLVMYSSNAGQMTKPPKLLLLDEPDGTLHPQMVQKLHKVLKNIASLFDSAIVFTTHSPTTVALFDSGPILRVSESDLTAVEKGAAIAELLVGLDQVSVHYTKSRTVYVESHRDAELYSELFSQLRRWNKGISEHLSLVFVPAAPKLPERNVRKILNASFKDLDADRVDAFVNALNGQGDCEQVKGAVESLIAGGIPAFGLIDWDLGNKTKNGIVVLGSGLFYNIENAILNPLSLGLYLLQLYPDKLSPTEYGLSNNYDLISIYSAPDRWQSIADAVTIKVIGQVTHSIECEFVNGYRVMLDTAYVHMNGHELETKVKETYQFLKAFNGRRTLLNDVVARGFPACQGRTIPAAFPEALVTIQAA